MRYIPPHSRYQDRADLLRLDDNTSPYPAPIDWNKIIQSGMSGSMHRYPVGDFALRERIAQLHGLSPEHVLCAAGSSEVLRLLFLTYAKGKRVLTAYPTFGLYSQMADEVGAQMTALSVNASGAIDPAAWRRKQPKHDVQVLCHPNNPTGRYETQSTMATLTEELAGVSIIDEAYGPFAEEDDAYASCAPTCDRRRFVVRSFKALGAANLRIGYALGDPDAIAEVRGNQIPFGISDLQIAVACEILDRLEEVKHSILAVVRERERVRDQLDQLHCSVIPSAGNFLLFQPPDTCNSDQLHAKLLEEHGIVIRRFDAPKPASMRIALPETMSKPFPLERMLRVTIGAPGQNDQLLTAVRASLCS